MVLCGGPLQRRCRRLEITCLQQEPSQRRLDREIGRRQPCGPPNVVQRLLRLAEVQQTVPELKLPFRPLRRRSGELCQERGGLFVPTAPWPVLHATAYRGAQAGWPHGTQPANFPIAPPL